MQLDQTLVAIRERNLLEILDLALSVIRTRALPMLLWLAVGVVPFLIINDFFINSEIITRTSWSAEEFTYEEEVLFGQLTGYLFAQCIIILEIPIATAPLTIYVSRIVFVSKPRFWEIIGTWFRCLWQLMILQVCVRTVLAALLLAPLPLYLMTNPFMNEIILLERGGFTTSSRRFGDLHRDLRSFLFIRSLAMLLGAGLLILCLWGGLVVLRDILLQQSGEVMQLDQALGLRWIVPVSIWLVVGYFTVVRFLNYLDVRIRQEGWEIELRMRAEGARLEKSLA